MSRQVFLVFFGKQRWTEAGPEEGDHAHAHAPPTTPTSNLLPVGPGAPHTVEHGAPVHPHESPWLMTVPLVVLSVGAVFAGRAEPALRRLVHCSTTGSSPVFAWRVDLADPDRARDRSWTARGPGRLVGIVLGVLHLPQGQTTATEQLELSPSSSPTPGTTTSHRRLHGRSRSTRFFAGDRMVRRDVIDGAVNGAAGRCGASAPRCRWVQTGYVRNYALGVAAGAVVSACLRRLRGPPSDERRVLAAEQIVLPAAHRAGRPAGVGAIVVALTPRSGPSSPRSSACSSPSGRSRSRSSCWSVQTHPHLGTTVSTASTTPGFQFVDTHVDQGVGISWHLGVDGISLFLVVLTGLLFPLAMLGVAPHHDQKPFYAWLLLLEAGCLGVFLVARPLPVLRDVRDRAGADVLPDRRVGLRGPAATRR